MLLWLFVLGFIRFLPLCAAVPFLASGSGGGGGDGGDNNNSRADRAEIAGMQIVTMSSGATRYFFVINEYKDDEITRQSCCMTDFEDPLRWGKRSLPCLETSGYSTVKGDILSQIQFIRLEQIMDRLYNYLDQKVLTEITTTMFLTFTKISTIADFSVKMSSDSFTSEEIRVSRDDFYSQHIPGFDAMQHFWEPQVVEQKQIIPYAWPQAA